MGNFPQHFLQEFPTRFSRKISHMIFPQDLLQDFPARFSHKNSCKIFMQDFRARFPTRFFRKISHKIFPQEFPARCSRKIFPQDFPELDPDWLAPNHPIPNAKFPPITALLIGLLIIKGPRCPHHPFPKSYGNPKSINKLSLMSQQ